jgi:hypothetical protein
LPLPVGPKLPDIGPQVADLLLVLDPRKKHGRVGDLAAWILDELLE